MANNKRRQKVLALVTRMREIEHRVAAGAAAEAMSAAHRSNQLAERAKLLADGYGERAGLKTGQDLARQVFSGVGMRNIADETSLQAGHARKAADARMKDERKARNKLDRVEERSVELRLSERQEAEKKQLAEQPLPGASRHSDRFGTELERDSVN